MQVQQISPKMQAIQKLSSFLIPSALDGPKSKEESAPSREPMSRAGAFEPNLMKGEEPHKAALTNRTVEC